MRTFFGLVGLAMFIGFSGLFVSACQDLWAYPDTPRAMTVREAGSRGDPGPGAWVELTDLHFPCDQPEQVAGSSHYRLGFGVSLDDRVIVSGARPCADGPVAVVGTLATAKPGRIAELAFPGFDFEQWPRPWQTTLWTASGPDDARDTVLLMPPFALLGLVVLAFFWKPQPSPRAALESLASTVDGAPWRDDERVLPSRPLELARSSFFDRLLTFSALLVMGWLLLVLGWLSFSSVGGWLGGAGVLLFVPLGLMLVGLALRVPAFWRRNTPLAGPRTECLAKVLAQRPLLAQGVDVGNLVVTFVHPVTGAPEDRVIGANEARPLLVDGHLFIVRGSDPKGLMIIGEDFTPFDLTPTEQREALRQLLRWVRSSGSR